MAQRRFGPTRGAGVAIIELDGDKPISPGALGYAGHAGLYEKGPPGEMTICLNKSTFLKKFGSYIADGLAPDAALDYYDKAVGAGALVVMRITDGNELKASVKLYARIDSPRTVVGQLNAKNGGRWGGKDYKFTGDFTATINLAETTLTTTQVIWKQDQLKGGYLELAGAPNKQYPIVGNSAAGVITVAGDQKMLTDFGVSIDYRYYVVLSNGTKALSYMVRDGEDNPNTEWALDVFVDGVLTKKYPNLNMDPVSGNYWVNVINNDDGNDEIEAVDLLIGAATADKRPANHYGSSAVLSATVLTAVIHEFRVTNSPGGGNPTAALGVTTDTHEPQIITLTMTGATAFNASSDRFGALGAGTFGVAFNPNNKWTPPFTVTAGGTPCAAADTLQLVYKPFKPSSLIDGKVYPDKVNQKRLSFRIVANTHKTITAADGSDLTNAGAILAGAKFLVEDALEFAGGRDGNANVVDATYNQKAWDPVLSTFNRTDGKNLGLVKFATPGITSTAVQKAGVAYASARNHQYRYEIPANIVTETGAGAYVEDTLGRNDYAVVAFPSYGYVPDPESTTQGKLKLVTTTGMIHGLEARFAVDYDGYHKAAAGIDATLPELLKITTGDAQLNEEFLNPIGIAVIKKARGNFVLWGDRTLYLDPNWKWKHQREMMSYYEHVLQEAFDFIVFAINDPVTEKVALTSLRSFFLPEFNKRALRGKTFEDACIIKIDAENNTNLTRASGDLNAEVKLRLADTVERFVIKIGKQGIFDSVG